MRTASAVRLPVLLVVLLAGTVRAETTITATPNATTVQVGDQLLIEIEVQADVDHASDPDLGPLELFELVNAVRTFQGTQIQSIFGAGQKVTITRRYQVVLIARKEGEQLFNRITVNVGGRTITAQPFRVTVLQQVGGAQAPSQQQSASEQLRQRLGRDEYFIDVQLEKNEAYVREGVLVRFMLYSIYGFSRWDGNAIGPNFFPGVQQVDIELPQNRQPQKQRVGDKTYQVYELRRAVLFPIRSGTITAEPQNVKVLIEYYVRGFFAMRQQDWVDVPTNRASLHVKPLPEEGKPEQFAGTVGQYKIKAEVDNAAPAVGGGFLLRVTVWGEGNVNAVEPPTLPDLPWLKRSRDYSKFDSQTRDNKVWGSAVFEYALSPLEQGEKTIPPIALAFFNPATQRYEVEYSQPITLQVQAPQELSLDGKVVLHGADYEPTVIDINAIDFRHIASALIGDVREGRPLYLGFFFWFLLVAPLLLLGASLVILREQQRMVTDEAYARRRSASRVVRRTLRQAEQAKNGGDARTFYGAVDRALVGFLRDHLHLETLGMTREQLHQALVSRLPEPGLADETIAFLETVDRFRFAGEQTTTRDEVMTQAEQLIRRWERVR